MIRHEHHDSVCFIPCHSGCFGNSAGRIPKISTVFLYEKDTIRQGLERFMVHGYTAVPVLNDQEQYIGSVTEGDFLRHLLACQTTDLKVQEGYRLGSIVRRDFALRYK